MPKLYKKATSEIVELVHEVKRLYHGDLLAEDVTIGVLTVEDSESPDPVLKHHGYPAAAIVKVVPYKERVKGTEDAELVIDLPTWDGLTEPERAAMIDHELHHLEVQKEAESDITKRDNADRPKLRLRVHDFEIGGFDVVVRRHGRYALEAQATAKAYQQLRQLTFDWTNDSREPDQPPDVREALSADPNEEARAVSLSALVALGMAEKTKELLEGADIFTIGQLADFAACGNLLTDIKGLGPTQAEKVDAALDEFLASRLRKAAGDSAV